MRKSSKVYPEVVERAVPMVFEAKDQYPSKWSAIDRSLGRSDRFDFNVFCFINTSVLDVLRRRIGFTQCVSIRYTGRLAEVGIEPTVGSRGNICDHALAETINGLYKAAPIHRRAPWKTSRAFERDTLGWVSWFNHHRPLEPIGYIPTAEAEANEQRQLASQAMPA